MSVVSIKPYLSSKLSTLGYTEWTDGFGEDNIPSTIIDRSFHQRFISADGVSVNQESFEMNIIHQIKIYYKGFNNPAEAIDQSLSESQSIIASCLNFKDYTDAGLTGLFLDGFTVEPFDETLNDNLVVATLNFSVRIFNCIA